MLTVVVTNSIYLIIYKMESPFFEQYKIQKNERWPWCKDKKEWKVLLIDTFKILVFNNLVLVPILLFFGMYMSDFEESHSLDI